MLRSTAAALVMFATVGGWPLVAADESAPRNAIASQHSATGRREMVVAENDIAAQAGLEILRHGGNAIDAAAAVSLVLGLTNAGSCGIGGGGFMLIYIARTRQLYALDYRERAPMAATATMYFRNGQPNEELARHGALAIAVPGEIAGLDVALRRFGTMKFSAIAAPAIRLARNGALLSPHLAHEVSSTAAEIGRDPGFRKIYFDASGAPLKAGALIRNPDLANLIERLGDKPIRNFYGGPIAEQIAGFINAHGGLMTARDLAEYKPIWRQPIHLDYHGYDVWTMPPPSSGGVVLEMLGMLGSEPLAGLGVDSPPELARLIEVMRQGFVDRDQYADPAFVNVPIAHLLSPSYLAEARERALHHAPPAPIAAAHDHGTSNFAVVDREGNVVDVTTTINTVFGSELMVPALGLILNNEMDDFATAPGIPNAFHLVGAKGNEIAPGKRPLSSMSPVIVLRQGHPVLVDGGSGGPTIITGVLQATLDALDFHLDPATAVGNPRIHHQAQPATVFVEAAMPQPTTRALAQMGYPLKTVPELGAVNQISIAPGKLRGAYDPRKGGGAAGD